MSANLSGVVLRASYIKSSGIIPVIASRGHPSRSSLRDLMGTFLLEASGSATSDVDLKGLTPEESRGFDGIIDG